MELKKSRERPQGKQNKTQISITTNPILHMDGHLNHKLQVDQTCLRTSSLNTSQYYPRSEVELKHNPKNVSFNAILE